MCDFNHIPDKLMSVKDLMREDQWVDVGKQAVWWGGIPSEPTCHSKEEAQRSRIDGFLVNPEALGTIHDFEVEHQTRFPTQTRVSQRHV